MRKILGRIKVYRGPAEKRVRRLFRISEVLLRQRLDGGHCETNNSIPSPDAHPIENGYETILVFALRCGYSLRSANQM